MIRLALPNKKNTALIQRCYDKLEHSVPLSILYGNMLTGHAFMYEQWSEMETRTNAKQMEMVYAAIVQICPAGLRCVVGGGLDRRIDIDEQFVFLKQCAIKLGKDAIRLMGRKSWHRRYLSKLGFVITEEWYEYPSNSRGIEVEIPCANMDYKL